jgi:predicted component of type VI protein secretion system
MTELIIVSGKHQGKKLALPETEIVIGRDEQCHLRLASSDVSRRHCALRSTAQGVVVRDLDSRNGCFINDLPIEGETLLHPGDVLRVGPLQLKVPGGKPLPDGPGERPETRVPKKPKAKADAASDDDIASWLSDVAPGESVSTSDTTIIPNRPAATAAVAAAPAPPTGVREPPVGDRKKFRSVADEAADIIRRHHEAKKKG